MRQGHDLALSAGRVGGGEKLLLSAIRLIEGEQHFAKSEVDEIEWWRSFTLFWRIQQYPCQDRNSFAPIRLRLAGLLRFPRRSGHQGQSVPCLELEEIVARISFGQLARKFQRLVVSFFAFQECQQNYLGVAMIPASL